MELLYNFDFMWLVFWLLAYFFVVLQYFTRLVTKKPGALLFPPLACICNFSWELSAIIRFVLDDAPLALGLWTHILCALLDIPIFLSFFSYEKRKKQRLIYVLSFAGLFVLFSLLFNRSMGLMMLSSFVIDGSMALQFVLYRDRLENRNIFGILTAASKLAGDLFAWIAYSGSAAVRLLGAGAVLCNLFYCIYVEYKYTVRRAYRAPSDGLSRKP